MSSSTAVVTAQSQVATFQDTMEQARVMHGSGFFPDCRTPEQAATKILVGREFGLGAYAALTGVQIVQGKPALSAGVVAGLVKRSGRYDYVVRRSDATACEIEWFERGQARGVSRYTMRDAEVAGLAGKGTWKMHPAAMLFARALTTGQRQYAPDVTMASVYTADELTGGEVCEVVAPDPVAAPVAVACEVIAPQVVEVVAEPGAVIEGEVVTGSVTGSPTGSLGDRLSAWMESVVTRFNPSGKEDLRSALVRRLVSLWDDCATALGLPSGDAVDQYTTEQYEAVVAAVENKINTRNTKETQHGNE